MDAGHDRLLFLLHVRWPHLHNHDRDRDSDYFLQGSDCHLQRSKPSEETAVHKIPELVLPGNHNVLLIRRKRYLLLQAHHSCRQGPATIRDAPSLHLVHAVHIR